MKYVYRIDDYDIFCSGESYNIGDEVLVYSRENLHREEYYISKHFAKDGYPGNLNADIKRYHGWRGATNDISVYAHGVYKINDIKHVDGLTIVYLNHKDLKRSEK